MFNSQMHYLFSLRKKYVEKFGPELEYRFFKIASNAYNGNEDINVLFDVIKTSEKDACVFNLVQVGFELPDEMFYSNKWDRNVSGGKDFVMLFYDTKGEFVGDCLSEKGWVSMRAKFVRTDAVWLWMVDVKHKNKIKDEAIREEILSRGEALGPYEMWFYWLNSTWR